MKFKIGDTVSHAEFGIGKIRSISHVRKSDNIVVTRKPSERWLAVEFNQADHRCHTCGTYRDGTCIKFRCEDEHGWWSREDELVLLESANKGVTVFTVSTDANYNPFICDSAEDVIDHISEVLKNEPVGQEITISVTKMTEEDFENLPDWDGP
jgi:hypothetical protein